MTFDDLCVLSYLQDTISSFDLNEFTNKDIDPLKGQHVLVNVIFSKIIQDIEIHLDITIKKKTIFEYIWASHGHDFLMVFILIVLARISRR